MTNKAISVTLRSENLLWLRGRTRASARRSVSETLDALISEARMGGRGGAVAATSVVGTIRIRSSDPGLQRADAVIRGLFRPAATRHGRRTGTAGRPSRRD